MQQVVKIEVRLTVKTAKQACHGLASDHKFNAVLTRLKYGVNCLGMRSSKKKPMTKKERKEKRKKRKEKR